MEKVVSSEKSKAPPVEAKREEHAPRRSPLSSEFDHRESMCSSSGIQKCTSTKEKTKEEWKEKKRWGNPSMNKKKRKEERKR